jgi:hypothetical protein
MSVQQRIGQALKAGTIGKLAIVTKQLLNPPHTCQANTVRKLLRKNSAANLCFRPRSTADRRCIEAASRDLAVREGN